MPPRVFNFVDDPDVANVFLEVTTIIVSESDRGAVLVGLSIVDQHLRKLFEHNLPVDMKTKDARASLFGYASPLGSVAAKVNVARAMNMIGSNVHRSVHQLRKLRNAVAHEPTVFRLSNHQNELRALCELGESMSEFIELSAQHVITGDLVARLKDMQIEIPGDDPIPAFNSVAELLERVQSDSNLMATLREKVLRMQLGLGVGYICGFIAAHREMASRPRSNDCQSES